MAVVSRSDRQRRLARERWERQEQRRRLARERARRRWRLLLTGVAAVIVLGAVAGGALWWSSGEDDLADLRAGSCTWVDTGATPAGGDVGTPPAEPVDPQRRWTAELVLDDRPVQVRLLAREAPCAVTSLQHLATAGYFDGTPCHRLTTTETLEVLQCGDPGGTGSGGPGYSFADENLEGATYEAGTVAMANSGPDSNGSQFFVVYGDSRLPPAYTVLGEVTSGLDVVRDIAAEGVEGEAADGPPARPVTLDRLTVSAA